MGDDINMKHKTKKEIYTEIKDFAQKHKLSFYENNTFHKKSILSFYEDIPKITKTLKEFKKMVELTEYKLGQNLTINNENYLISFMYFDSNYEMDQLICLNSQGIRYKFKIQENELINQGEYK